VHGLLTGHEYPQQPFFHLASDNRQALA